MNVDLHPLLNLSLTPANPSLKTPSFFFYDPSFGSFSSSPELNIPFNLSLILLKVPLILSFIYPKSGLGISMFSKVLKKISSLNLMLSITSFVSQLDLDCISTACFTALRSSPMLTISSSILINKALSFLTYWRLYSILAQISSIISPLSENCSFCADDSTGLFNDCSSNL